MIRSLMTAPIAIFLILAAFDLICLRERNALRAGLAGGLFGLAGMVTIKSAMFLRVMDSSQNTFRQTYSAYILCWRCTFTQRGLAADEQRG